MKLPTSDKSSVFGKKPYIEKGYYPAKLLKVEPYMDKEKNLILGKYGRQLIFEFAIYSKDENKAPVTPMIFKEDGQEDIQVRISKFVYHEYKNKENPGKFQTAITPNSAITKLLTALGWKFSTEDIDTDPLIGNWIEVNIDNYTAKTRDEGEYIASTIKDINPYEGPEVKNVEDVKATEPPKKVDNQIKHEAVKENPTSNEDEIKKKEGKIEEMKQLNKQDLLSDEGLKQCIESIEAEIEGLKK